LVQDLYVPPWGYADNTFLLKPADATEESMEKLADEAVRLTREYFDKHGIPHKLGDPPDGSAGDKLA
jgi:hypothetical protein